MESSQIEPSLELGDRVLRQCADHIAAWKGGSYDERLLRLPEQLLRARRDVRYAAAAGVPVDELARVNESLDRAARAVTSLDATTAGNLLDAAHGWLSTIKAQLASTGVHAFREHGFDSAGIEGVGGGDVPVVSRAGWRGVAFGGDQSTISFAVTEDVRAVLQHGGHTVGRVCFEHPDDGTDPIEVLVDAVATASTRSSPASRSPTEAAGPQGLIGTGQRPLRPVAPRRGGLGDPAAARDGRRGTAGADRRDRLRNGCG